MRSTKFNSYYFFQIVQLQKFTLEYFPRYWSLKNLPRILPSSNWKYFFICSYSASKSWRARFLPFTCLARHLWGSSLKFCYSYFNSTKPRWFTLLGLLGEKLILVNLNSESFPLKNILNDIKKFKIKKMNSKTTKFIFSAKRLSDKEFSFFKRYKFKSIFFWTAVKTIDKASYFACAESALSSNYFCKSLI